MSKMRTKKSKTDTQDEDQPVVTVVDKTETTKGIKRKSSSTVEKVNVYDEKF